MLTERQWGRVELLHECSNEAADKALECLDAGDRLGFIAHQQTAMTLLARINYHVCEWTREDEAAPKKTVSVVFGGDGRGGVIKTIREYDSLGDAAEAVIGRVSDW